MTDFELSVSTSPSADDLAAIDAGLDEHALSFTDRPGFEPLAVLAHRNGSLAGGASGCVNWNWLHVKLLWVVEDARGSGLGSELLTRLESEALARGCVQAHLDTFSFQARPFYERHGYEVFGTLEGYPPEHSRFFLRKQL